MVDASLNTWLIEVNTNPCLEQAGAYLTEVIPRMVDDVLKTAVDAVFPPPAHMTLQPDDGGGVGASRQERAARAEDAPQDEAEERSLFKLLFEGPCPPAEGT